MTYMRGMCGDLATNVLLTRTLPTRHVVGQCYCADRHAVSAVSTTRSLTWAGSRLSTYPEAIDPTVN